MPEQNNIAAVKGFLAAQYAGDFDTAFGDFAHADFTWIVGAANSETLRAAIPWAGYEHHGKEGYITLTTLLFSEFEALDFATRTFTDTGEAVYVEGRFVFRHRETAKIAESDFMARFDMRDHRVSGGQFYEDTAAVASARIA